MKSKTLAILTIIALCLSLATALAPPLVSPAQASPLETLHLSLSQTMHLGFPTPFNSRNLNLQPGDEVIQFTRPNFIAGTNPMGVLQTTIFPGTPNVSGDLSGTLYGEVQPITLNWDGLGGEKGCAVAKPRFDDAAGNTFNAVSVFDFDTIASQSQSQSHVTGYMVSTSGTGIFSGQVLIGTRSDTSTYDPVSGNLTSTGTLTLRRYSGSEISGPTAISGTGTDTSGNARSLGSSDGPNPDDEFIQFSRSNIVIAKGDPALYVVGGSASSSVTGALAGTMTQTYNTIYIPGTPSSQGLTIGKFTVSNASGTVNGVFVCDLLESSGAGSGSGNAFMFALRENATGAYADKDFYGTGTYTETSGAFTFNGNLYILEPSTANQPPAQPSNFSPANGATGISVMPTLRSSAFADPDIGDTHAASQWQVRTSSGSYSSPVFDSGTDSSNLTQITLASGILSSNTIYYWRVRHQDSSGAWSDWSAETSFITAAAAPTPTPTLSNTLTVASMIGDPVSTTPAGPFVPATTAYLGTEVGRIQPDGGLPEYAHIDGTYWIWMDDFIGDIDNPLYFLKTFSIPEGAIDITGTMQITADNFFNLSINDVDYGGTEPPDTFQFENIYTSSITNLLPGENHLLITASEAIPGTPSGLMYKLVIYYTGGQPTPTPTPTATPAPPVVVETPAGGNVTVSVPGAVMTFDTITVAGNTTVTTTSENPVGPTPSGFNVAGLFVDISTTANYTGNVTVGISYDPSTPNPQNLRLFHYEGGNWVDVTTWVDTSNHIIYGEVSSLSWFFIGGQWVWVETAPVPVFPSVYIGIMAALGAGVVAYAIRRRLVRLGQQN